MARRVVLHVGTPKSGTTYLQSVWWANQAELREQDVLLPGDGVHEHFWASCVVRDNRRLLRSLPAEASGAWERLLAQSASWSGDVLVSHELFSPAPDPRVAAALADLAEVAEEVHVVLTARDLARQLPAEWQQRTKHGRFQRLSEFVEEVRTDPASPFWRVQDVPAVLTRWSQGIPAEQVHLVVLPPPGGPRTFLWDRLCELTGVDGEGMAERAVASNESLGLVEAETMRRVSERLNADGLAKSTERLMKGFFAEQVLRSPDPEKIVAPAEVHPWLRERAEAFVAELDGRGYDVVGRVEDLVPGPEPALGRGPDDVGEDEVSRAAVAALARFVRHEERARRGARRPGGGSAAGGDAGDARDAAGRDGSRLARLRERIARRD